MNIFFLGGVKMIDDFLFTCIYNLYCFFLGGGGVEVQGCIHFSFEAHLSSTLLTMKLTELHWIRQLQYQACTTCSIRCCIPAKKSNVNIRFETDNRTSAECNVTPFIITSNDIITGKLDLRIYQMSTMLMRYVFMVISTR